MNGNGNILQQLYALLHSFILAPILGVLRYLLPDLLNDGRGSDNDIDLSTSPLVMPTPGFFPQAHHLRDLRDSSEDGSGVLAGATARPTLRQQQQATAHTSSSAADRSAPQHNAAAPGPVQVYVMRHGERQDMVDAGWAAQAERGWDPPLSDFGVKQATQRGQQLAGAGVSVRLVITSPFTRCIQTSCAFMRAYGVPPERLVVDARLCEWMSSRNLNLDRLPPGANARMKGETKAWFWGAAASKGIQQAVTEAWSATAATQASIGSLRFPAIPESQDAARARFQRSVAELSSGAQGSVLMVTHGDAVGAVVENACGGGLVYQVDTTGYVVLMRSPNGQFEVTDASGVAWMEE